MDSPNAYANTTETTVHHGARVSGPCPILGPGEEADFVPLSLVIKHKTFPTASHSEGKGIKTDKEHLCELFPHR